MIRFLTDENFHGAIVDGLLRRLPAVDLVRAVDVGLRGEPDPILLEWSALHDRVVISHDFKTMPRHAFNRVRRKLSMPGVWLIHDDYPIGAAIDELVLIATCSRDDEWRDQVRYLPL